MVFSPAEVQAADLAPERVVIIHRGKLLCAKPDRELPAAWRPLPVAALEWMGQVAHQHYLGQLDGQPCFAMFYQRGEAPSIEGYEWCSLRSQLGVIDEELFQLAGRALQLTRWYREHQFCGVCAAPTVASANDRSLICSRCETRFYPRISPCVIGLITRGRECLLAHSSRHPSGVFSTLAGFVEAGETLEQAFAREVKEEVGVDIHQLRYFGSQPWPFPGQLMVGFTADYLAGEIQVDGEEILEARWFTFDKLPAIPPASTISGRIIRWFVETRQTLEAASTPTFS